MALDLITLAEYKNYANISSTNQDAAISSLIPTVSSLIKQLCRRTFLDYVDDFKTDTFKGPVNNKLLLPETPVLTVNSVEFSDNYGKTYETLVEFEEYVVDGDAVEIIAAPYADYFKTNAFKVTYTAGYETLPEDLKLAAIDLVTYYLRNEPTIRSTKSVGSNNVQIEYVTTTGLPAHIRRVLDLYTAYYG